MLSGAQVVLECLREQGVDTVFGYPGGAVIPLYDALYDYRRYFKHVLTAHEQGAVHCADGYARSTGRVGVCFATSGPGATNTITGIATAYMDSVPLVVITGQVPTALLGKDSFQEIDITGITLPITKHNYLVEDIGDLADIIRKAFHIASTGRPGPVLVDIPKDILLQKVDYVRKEAPRNSSDMQSYPDKDVLIKAAEMINKCCRPVIYAGGGVIISGASQILYRFALRGDIPVVNTLTGLGSFPRNHRLSLGLVGMHGSRESNLAVANSDLVIAIGARFSDRVIGDVSKFAPRASIIHMDIDKTEIGKNKRANLSIIGDVKDILERLVEYIEKKERTEWLSSIYSWKRMYCSGDEFSPRNILETINELCGEDTIVVTDVGQHQMWTAQYWKFKGPRTFLTSGGLGTMGFGLGAAVGALVGNPKRQVVLITGDGSFRMNCNELATVSRYGMPLLVVLFNNNALGMVRQWQKMFQGERYSETDMGNEVDYIRLAAAYGISGYKVQSLRELEEALSCTKGRERPALIECVIDKDECVYPIVPPGKPIDQLIQPAIKA